MLLSAMRLRRAMRLWRTGFERIYDTEKDKIYKATNGWSDKYEDDRFKLVTDDSMYTRPIDGYIDY